MKKFVLCHPPSSHLRNFEPALKPHPELYLIPHQHSLPERRQSISPASILHLLGGPKRGWNSWTSMFATKAHPRTCLAQSLIKQNLTGLF